MLTTVFGIGVLALAVFPAIGQFGVITGMSIAYAFFASMLVLPATLVVWDAIVNDDVSVRSLFLPGITGKIDRDEPSERTRS
jgi:hypothetical protein